MAGVSSCGRLWLSIAALACASASGVGCRLVDRVAAWRVVAIAEGNTTKELFAETDIDKACETAISFHSFLASMGRLNNTPHRILIITELGAGICAELEAWDAELAGLHAYQVDQTSAARDAREREKRAHYKAATRFYASWRHVEAAFGKIDSICRPLSEANQRLYLLGLSAGVLAVMHDRAAGGAANVPTDIPVKAAWAARCLDDSVTWGAASALRAAVWVTVPGAGPDRQNPHDVLASGVVKGERSRVRLARAFQIVALSSEGDDFRLRTAIIDHAAALRAESSHPQWRLLDEYATRIVRHEADKIWVAQGGARSDHQALGSFPGIELEAVDPEIFESLPGLQQEYLPQEGDAPIVTKQHINTEVNNDQND